MQKILDGEPDFWNHVLWHYTQNVRYWSPKNAVIMNEMPLDSSKITVRYGVFSDNVMSTYFFEDAHCATVTINGV